MLSFWRGKLALKICFASQASVYNAAGCFLRLKELDMTGRIARAVILALVVALPSIDMAFARTPYDGTWSITLITTRGSCDSSYSFGGVQITNGIVSHPNLVKFRGRVSANGRVHVSVTAGERYASGSGRLSASSGRGRWSGRSGTGPCSGSWTAQRG